LIQTRENFTNGSLAEKIQYDVYEENKVLKSKKKARSNSKAKLKFVACILLVFSLCFVVILRYAQITEMNYKISTANKVYSNLKIDNSYLKVSIEANMELEKVREAATKLGMHKPDKYQIIYLKIPKTDFTKVADDSNVSKRNMFSVISEKINEFARLLY
jgi:cell division protein FtsL